METILGPDPATTLQNLLTSRNTLTSRQLKTYWTDVLQSHAVNGSAGISLVEFQGHTILLAGEIHENERLCASKTYDVVKHVVLRAMKENQNTVLLVEGFVNALSKDRKLLLSEIRQHPYRDFVACMKGKSYTCQYRRGNLLFLRTFKLLLHAASLFYPHHRSLRGFNDRVMFFDIRKALGMQTPFVDWDAMDVSSRTKYIRRSLSQIDKLPTFLPTIGNPALQQSFERHVLTPYMQLAHKIQKNPTPLAYTSFFIQIPDVLAVNLIFTQILQGHVPITYAGENHRLNVLRLLRKMGTVKVIAESIDRTDGSCSKPTSAFWRF